MNHIDQPIRSKQDEFRKALANVGPDVVAQEVPSMTEKEFNKAVKALKLDVFTKESLLAYQNDLRKALVEKRITATDLEKGMKDLSQLVKVQKTDRNGKKITVWVKRGEAPAEAKPVAKKEEPKEPLKPGQTEMSDDHKKLLQNKQALHDRVAAAVEHETDPDRKAELMAHHARLKKEIATLGGGGGEEKKPEGAPEAKPKTDKPAAEAKPKEEKKPDSGKTFAESDDKKLLAMSNKAHDLSGKARNIGATAEDHKKAAKAHRKAAEAVKAAGHEHSANVHRDMAEDHERHAKSINAEERKGINKMNKEDLHDEMESIAKTAAKRWEDSGKGKTDKWMPQAYRAAMSPEEKRRYDKLSEAMPRAVQGPKAMAERNRKAAVHWSGKASEESTKMRMGATGQQHADAAKLHQDAADRLRHADEGNDESFKEYKKGMLAHHEHMAKYHASKASGIGDKLKKEESKTEAKPKDRSEVDSGNDESALDDHKRIEEDNGKKDEPKPSSGTGYQSHTTNAEEAKSVIARQKSLLANPKSPAGAKKRAQEIIDAETKKHKIDTEGRSTKSPDPRKSDGPYSPAGAAARMEYIRSKYTPEKKEAHAASAEADKAEGADSFKNHTGFYDPQKVGKKEDHEAAAKAHEKASEIWKKVDPTSYIINSHAKKAEKHRKIVEQLSSQEAKPESKKKLKKVEPKADAPWSVKDASRTAEEASVRANKVGDSQEQHSDAAKAHGKAIAEAEKHGHGDLANYHKEARKEHEVAASKIASGKAREASEKAEKSGDIDDHRAAYRAHEKAYNVLNPRGGSDGTREASQQHLDAQVKHRRQIEKLASDYDAAERAKGSDPKDVKKGDTILIRKKGQNPQHLKVTSNSEVSGEKAGHYISGHPTYTSEAPHIDSRERSIHLSKDEKVQHVEHLKNVHPHDVKEGDWIRVGSDRDGHWHKVSKIDKHHFMGGTKGASFHYHVGDNREHEALKTDSYTHPMSVLREKSADKSKK